MKRAAIGVATALALYGQAAAQEFVTGAERDAAIADAKSGCVESFKEDPSLKVEPAAVENYCQCVGVQMVGVITKAEADKGVMTPEMQARGNEAAKSCLPLLKAGLKQ